MAPLTKVIDNQCIGLMYKTKQTKFKFTNNKHSQLASIIIIVYLSMCPCHKKLVIHPRFRTLGAYTQNDEHLKKLERRDNCMDRGHLKV